MAFIRTGLKKRASILLARTADARLNGNADAELEALRARVASITSTLSDVVWSVEVPSNEIVYVSPAVEAVFGKTAEQMCRQLSEWSDLIHPEDRERVLADWNQALRGGSIETEYRVITPQGAQRWIETRGQPARDASGAVIRIDGMARDITERRSREETIARLSRIQAVHDSIKSIIGRVRDRRELLRNACRIAHEQGGFSVVWAGLIDHASRRVRAIAHHGFDAGAELDFDLPVGDAARDGDTEYRVLTEGAPCYCNDIRAEPATTRIRQIALERGFRSVISLPLIVGDVVEGVMFMYSRESGFFNADEVRLLSGLAADISLALEKIDTIEKLAFLARYDELTGLPNRALFLDHLGGTLRKAREAGTTTAVAVGNLRRLRRVNECFGWSAGDALLRAFAQRVRTQWPEPEQLARISGDTFALILPNLNDPVAIAATVDRTIESATELPFFVEGHELRIALIVGVTVCPPDADDPQTLLLNAEAALQRARLSGERMLFYQPDMNARVAETLLLENRLRGALEREEFELHYQPKVEAASGRVTGLEALIRWRDPQQGLVPPARFIPILEETGLIREVGAWAIRKALTESREWRLTHGGPLRVAVNVSPVQLKQPNFVDTVRRAVECRGIAAAQLDLEITETMVMDDVAGNVRKIQALRDIGVQVAVDDFGTGYSSLGYLAQLPVNALKIDRAFVATMTSDAHSTTLVSTIISLAHTLGLKVIAEGVETDEQARMLRLLRCDELQGYLYSKPLKATEVEAFLRR